MELINLETKDLERSGLSGNNLDTYFKISSFLVCRIL
jgi:hypothetical protein